MSRNKADRKGAAAAYDKAAARKDRAMAAPAAYVEASTRALHKAVKSGDHKAIKAATEIRNRAVGRLDRTYRKHTREVEAAYSQMTKAQRWWNR